MARRRTLTGKPLLVAKAAVLFTVGCGGEEAPVGNLMAPPEERVCVEALPKAAEVKVNGKVLEQPCTMVYQGNKASIEVSAPGFITHTANPTIDGPLDLNIKLQRDRPVGNLMPPQPRPKPVKPG